MQPRLARGSATVRAQSASVEQIVQVTTHDVAIVRIAFGAVATIVGARDALPGDNRAVSRPTVVRPRVD